MFALETAAGESNSLFLMCGRASTTRYDDVVDDVLQTVLFSQASADGERTNSVEVLRERPKRGSGLRERFL